MGVVWPSFSNELRQDRRSYLNKLQDYMNRL